MSPSSPAQEDDGGAVLVIVLLFVLVVSMIFAAIVEQTRASVANSVVVRNQQALTFAADAGIERGINEVRRDLTLCPAEDGSVSDVLTMTDNNRTVFVKCEVVEGASSGVFGYAVITTDDSADSLTTQGGGEKVINGPVWSRRLENGNNNSLDDLTVTNGDLREQAGANSCSLADGAPGGVSVEPAGLYGYKCTGSDMPAFSPTLPQAVPGAAPEPTDVDDCRTLYPGRYAPAGSPAVVDGLARAWPGFLEQNYLVSGVYLLEDVQVVVTGTQQVVGGRQLEDDTLDYTPCSNDSVDPTAQGTGAKLLLGGSTTVTTTSNGGGMELFRRVGGPESEGTQGLSVMQVPSGASGWPESDLSFGQDILQISSGANPSLAVHGIASVPAARINIDNASNLSGAQFTGGLIAGRLHLQNSGSSTGLVVSIDTEESARTVRLTSRTKLDAGDKEIVATAVVRIEADPQRNYQVLSWHSTN